MAATFISKSSFSRYNYLVFNYVRDVKTILFRTCATKINDLEKDAEIQYKMENSEFSVTATLSSEKEITIRSGKLAKLADGCALAVLDDTTVMATVVSRLKSEKIDFTPLTVAFKQKAAALGRIPLNFFRRELGESENEILISRMIDRSVRPLFPSKFNWETQLICNPLALDGNNYPDILAINAASAALALSNIPWNGPVGAVRIGLIDENFVINPDKKQLNDSKMNLVVVSKSKNYGVMLEGSFSNLKINEVMKAIKLGVKESQKIVNSIKDLCAQCGKTKRVFKNSEKDLELYEEIKSLSIDSLREIFQNHNHDKMSRDSAVFELRSVILDQIRKKFPSQCDDADQMFNEITKNVFRNLIFETNIRCDGRTLNMLRNIECDVNLFKPLHGSALFQRGQTQVLCTVSLDSPNSALKIDRVSMLTSGLKEKNFFVHYQFPPFAVNEIGKVGPINRREIGHGCLAEKALKANIPDNFPFTVRLTSEVLESNGSSSMATVCGGCLALLDAGIPIKNATAGVAMGVVTRWSEEGSDYVVEDYRILTDLLGIEDYMGDMDFKIAGTKKFVTALQMDVKTPGLPLKIIMDSIIEAKSAINTILKKMATVCSEPRTCKKENWPVIEKITVPIHLRSKFIGPSGMNIKKLEMNAGVDITEEVPGEFQIFAANKVALEEAIEVVKDLLESYKEPVLEFGGVYTATVTEIKEHGCMVTLYPNMQPVLVPVSQLDHRKVLHPSVLGIEVGQEIQLKYFGRDPVSGVMRLSRKVLQTTGPQVPLTFFKKEAESPAPTLEELQGDCESENVQNK